MSQAAINEADEVQKGHFDPYQLEASGKRLGARDEHRCVYLHGHLHGGHRCVLPFGRRHSPRYGANTGYRRHDSDPVKHLHRDTGRMGLF